MDYKSFTELLKTVIEKKDKDFLLKFLSDFSNDMINLKNKYNYTPLHYLMKYQFSNCSDQLEILEMFRGEMIELKNKYNYTPLHLLMMYQISKCSNQLEILKMFHNEMITLKNTYNQTPLDNLMKVQFYYYFEELKKEIVKLFKEHLTDYEDKIKDYIEPENELLLKVKRGTVVRIEYID